MFQVPSSISQIEITNLIYLMNIFIPFQYKEWELIQNHKPNK